MHEPVHITNLRRASDEAWAAYEAAIDSAIDKDTLQEMGKCAELLTSLYHNAYTHDFNTVYSWDAVPAVVVVDVPAVLVS